MSHSDVTAHIVIGLGNSLNHTDQQGDFNLGNWEQWVKKLIEYSGGQGIPDISNFRKHYLPRAERTKKGCEA